MTMENDENIMWTVRKSDGTIYGPADTEAMKRWIQEKRVLPEDYISPEGWEEWRQVQSLPQFAGLFKVKVVPADKRRCHGCGKIYPKSIVICMECGINLITGEQLSRPKKTQKVEGGKRDLRRQVVVGIIGLMLLAGIGYGCYYISQNYSAKKAEQAKAEETKRQQEIARLKGEERKRQKAIEEKFKGVRLSYLAGEYQKCISVANEVLSLDAENEDAKRYIQDAQAKIKETETQYRRCYAEGEEWENVKEWGKAKLAYTEALKCKPDDMQASARFEECDSKLLYPGKTITVALGSGVKMELVYIPHGEFVMGSPTSEKGRYSDEGPRHKVKITNGFYLGKYEVTQEQYEVVMGKNPSHFKVAKNPVERVEWNDAVEFCRKLSQKTGKNYRLPTEAEWEYACRAGTSTAYIWGNKFKLGKCNVENNDLENWVNTYERKNISTFRRMGLPTNRTMSVGKFSPNAFGLYDMHGNGVMTGMTRIITNRVQREIQGVLVVEALGFCVAVAGATLLITAGQPVVFGMTQPSETTGTLGSAALGLHRNHSLHFYAFLSKG